MDIDYTEFCELTEAIQALTERVDVVERLACQGDTLLIDLMEKVERLEIDNRSTQMFINEYEDRFGPVLNDGKAKPSKDIIILDHPMDHMVSDEDLDNIYVSPAVNSWPKPMWEVARGNTMRGILYSFEDAKLFAEVIKY